MSLRGDCLSQLMRKFLLTEEASVCVWLCIDHMGLTRVESGRMFGEDDDFIPHHMYQLEVICRSLCPAAVSRASPPSIYKGSIHKVSQAPVDEGNFGCEDAFNLTQQSPLSPSGGCNIRQGVGHTLDLGSAYRTQNSPLPGLSLCWCAIQQQCYLFVSTMIYLYIYVYPGGWKELR